MPTAEKIIELIEAMRYNIDEKTNSCEKFLLKQTKTNLEKFLEKEAEKLIIKNCEEFRNSEEFIAEFKKEEESKVNLFENVLFSILGNRKFFITLFQKTDKEKITLHIIFNKS